MAILDLVYFIPLVGIVCGLFGFVLAYKHLLNILLRLEFIIVNLF